MALPHESARWGFYKAGREGATNTNRPLPQRWSKHRMAKSSLISVSDLRKALSCNFDLGDMVWLERPKGWLGSEHGRRVFNSRFAGKRAFTGVDGDGYLVGRIDGRRYFAHRVIWALYHGKWPRVIDHINQVKTDNRLCNLREVSVAQNNRNRAKQRNNTSGFTGVVRRGSKWRAYVVRDSKMHHVGVFESAEDAFTAREKVKAGLGFSPTHGL